MSRNATIALVQMDCVMLDKEANLQKAKAFIEQAAQQHADLICFPEMFSTGYSPALIGPKYCGELPRRFQNGRYLCC